MGKAVPMFSWRERDLKVVVSRESKSMAPTLKRKSAVRPHLWLTGMKQPSPNKLPKSMERISVSGFEMATAK